MKTLFTLALFAGIAGAQSASTPLTGAWKVVETTTTGPDGKTTVAQQPGLLIFTRKYYSVVWDHSATPRPDLNEDATDAQLLASRRAVQAQLGTYEVSGSTVSMHPIVAANPNNMHPAVVIVQSFKLEGKTLLLTQISTRGGPVANPTTTKYTRVE
jgi:hypothetical protein